MSRQSIPNLLTALRIVLGIAVFFALAWAKATGNSDLVYWAFAAYVVGALTDFFDGWLARRWKVTSVWGAILDPIADKMAVAAALFGLLLIEPRFGIALPGLIILSRELFVSGLREVAAGRGVRFPVTQLAKWKTTAQLVALSTEMLVPALVGTWVHTHLAIGGGDHSGLETLHTLQRAADALLWIAAALTVWTGWAYANAARVQLRD